MRVSTPDLSDTRAEVDSPSGPAATSVALRLAPGHVNDAGSGVPAAKVQAAAVDGARAGDREHLKGRFIERLDVSTYNAKNGLTGKMLDPRPNSKNPAYDASRYIKGKFAGGVWVIPLLVSLAAAEH